MRRLLITLAFPPDIGGMQAFAYQRALGCSPDDVIVLAPDFPGCRAFDQRQPFQIHRWNRFLGHKWGIKRVFQFFLPLIAAIRLHRAQGFGVIECWQPLPFGLAAYMLKKSYGIPYIVWSHGSDILTPQKYRFFKTLLRFVLKNASILVANSQSTAGEYLRLGQSPERVLVIHPPADTDLFRPDVDCTEVITRHRLECKCAILTVSRLIERKGIDTVIKAMPTILEVVPNAVYVVVGDGPYQKCLEELSERLGVQERVIFTGRVEHYGDQLPQYYNVCDVFVMVSRVMRDEGDLESFGIAYLEAGACAKPVIGGIGGGTDEAVEHGITGLLVDPLDVDAVASAIVRLLQDPELARTLGENGRKRAAQRPDWSVLEQVGA